MAARPTTTRKAAAPAIVAHLDLLEPLALMVATEATANPASRALRETRVPATRPSWTTIPNCAPAKHPPATQAAQETEALTDPLVTQEPPVRMENLAIKDLADPPAKMAVLETRVPRDPLENLEKSPPCPARKVFLAILVALDQMDPLVNLEIQAKTVNLVLLAMLANLDPLAVRANLETQVPMAMLENLATKAVAPTAHRLVWLLAINLCLLPCLSFVTKKKKNEIYFFEHIFHYLKFFSFI